MGAELGLSERARAGALVDSARMVPYFAILWAAHAWSVSLLYVACLVVLIRLFMLDLNKIDRSMDNRRSLPVVGISVVRIALLVVSDVPWGRVVELSLDAAWIVAMLLLVLLLAAYCALGVAQDRVAEGRDVSGAASEHEVNPVALPRRARMAMLVNVALGRCEFAVESRGITYEVSLSRDDKPALAGRMLLYAAVAAALLLTALLWQVLRVDLKALSVVAGLGVLALGAVVYALTFRERLAACVARAKVVARG